VREQGEGREEVEPASASLSVPKSPCLGRRNGRSDSVLATYRSKVVYDSLVGHPDINDTALHTFHGLKCKLRTSP
jgi:hypothetical protein